MMKRNKFSGLLTFVMSILGCLASTEKTVVDNCTPGQYYSDFISKCMPCSFCSNNDLVRKPCSSSSDTVCGPFKEFEFFHQPVADNSSKDRQNVPKILPKKTEVHLKIYSEGHSNIAVAESKESQHWRKVAFALIGALSGLIFLATLVVLVLCRRMNVPHPPRPADTDDDDADCPYVVIHTIRPSEDDLTYQVAPGPNALHQLARQRSRLYKYHPKRRLLQANEYADDVFESEDSAGSRRRISLQVIPETGHSDTEGDTSPKSKTFPHVKSSTGDPGSSLPHEDSKPAGNESADYSAEIGSRIRYESDKPQKSAENNCISDCVSKPEDKNSTKDLLNNDVDAFVSSTSPSSCIHSSPDTICLSSSGSMIRPSSPHSPKVTPCLTTKDAMLSSCSSSPKHTNSQSPSLCTDQTPRSTPSSDLESDGLLPVAASEHPEHTAVHLNHCLRTPPKKPPPSPGVVSPLTPGLGVTSPTLPVTCEEEDLPALMETSSLLRSHIPLLKTSGTG